MPIRPAPTEIPDPPVHQRCLQRCADERGFGLVELVVVMVVIAVLCAIGAVTMLNAKRDSTARSISAAGRSYSQAVTAFRLDHRRLPVLGDARDWPNAAQGPLDAFGKPYLRDGAPEALQNGTAGLGTDLQSATAGDGAGGVVYEAVDTQRFRITVHAIGENGLAEFCQVGTAVAAGAKPC